MDEFVSTVRLATEMVRDQSLAPISPCEVDEKGRVSLCAAAAIAAARVELSSGAEARTHFVRHLASTKNRQLVQDIFRDAGWSSNLCETVFAKNDVAPPEQRRETVLQMFAELEGAEWH